MITDEELDRRIKDYKGRIACLVGSGIDDEHLRKDLELLELAKDGLKWRERETPQTILDRINNQANIKNKPPREGL